MLKANILIVEDEKIVALDIQNTLENNGFMVAGQADQGEEAVEKARKLHPDLVLMDIGLKGEMDGIEAAIQIRAQFDLPVIFLTAYSNPAIIDRARLAEPFAYIIKPFEERELVSNIEMALYKHGMEKKLRESENKFRSVIEQATDGIALVDNLGSIVEWNPAMEQITGLKHPEVLGQPIWEITFQLLPREERNTPAREAHALIWKSAITGAYSDADQVMERVIETPQGAHRIIQSNGFSISTSQGTMAGVIMRDISKRRKAEQEIINSEKRFRALIENGRDNISLLAADGTLLWESPSVVHTMGYAQNQFVGRNIFELMHPDDIGWTQNLFKQVIQNPGSREDGTFRLLRSDGSWRWIEATATNLLDEPSVQAVVINYRDITERKQAEEAVAHSHELMRYIIEHNRSAIAVHDKDLKYIYVSQRYLNDYKVKEKDVIGKHHYDVFPDLPQKWKDVHQKALAGEILNAEDDPYVREDGSVDWTRWECRPWYEVDGSIGGIVIYTEVITERKQAEEALRESQRRQKAILDNIPDMAWLKDKEYRFIAVNEPFGKTCGLKPEDLVGKTDFDIWSRDLAERYRADDKEVMESGERKQVIEPLLDIENQALWIETIKTPIFDEQGIVIGTAGIARDMTERKRTEAELRKLSQAVEQSANAIVITDIEGKIEFANPKFVEVSGYSLPEALGQNPRILRSGEHDPEFYKTLWNTIKSGRVWRGELHNRRKDGRLYWEDSTITPVYDAAHNLVNFIAIKEDITARKILEEAERDQRQLAEALRDTSTALTSTLNLDDVLDRVLDNIGKLVTYDAAMVLLIEGHSVRKIRHRNHEAYGASDQPRLGNTQANLINVPILHAIRETRKPCLIPDTQADERWRAVPGMGWVRSFISAPVEIRGRVAGLINILSEKPGFFTSFHSERLMAFASQAAVAIENAQLFEQAYHLSITDPLTEVSNRRQFFEVAKFEFERTHRYKRTLSVMMADIDHFKNINDIHGHSVGDLALREVATRIKSSVRAVDIVARYGGEEFIVLMPETGLHEARQVAERVRRSVADAPIEEEAATVTVTLSIGVAEMDEYSKNIDQLIIYADQALYAAKAAGRNRVAGYGNAGNVHVEAEL